MKDGKMGKKADEFELLISSMVKYFDEHPEEFEYLGSGRHRQTYLHKNKGYVIKVARDAVNGIVANLEELEIFRYRDKRADRLDGHDVERYARCRRLNDVAIVMEYVDPAMDSDFEDGDIPSWTQEIDCGQVGWTAKGKLVAYDYSMI